jgi:hypothetical protein
MSNWPAISDSGELKCPKTKEEITMIDLSPGEYADAPERLVCGTCAKKNKLPGKSPSLDLQQVSIRTSAENKIFVASI